MRRAGILGLFGAVAACQPFTAEGPIAARATADAGAGDGGTSHVIDPDGGSAGVACEDRSAESAEKFCKKQALCDDFETDGFALWVEDVGTGKLDVAPGRSGRALVARLGPSDDRARLTALITGAKLEVLHVDFDLHTTQPAFASKGDPWLDIVQFAPTTNIHDIGTGFEWAPNGLRVFYAGAHDLIDFPAQCNWVHVHMTVRLRDDTSGSYEVSFNGQTVMSRAGVVTASVPVDGPYIAIGPQASEVQGLVEVLYDNVSAYATPDQ